MMQLQDTEFAPCSVSWDETQNKFRKNNRDEVYLCCDRKCDKYRMECDKFCHEKHNEAIKGTLDDCLFSCKVMGNVCDKMCQSARFTWNQKYFDNCLQDAGCLRNEYLNNQCLIDKKDDLLRCCLQKCRPEKDLNCEQHCGISYDINLERSIPQKIPKNYELTPTKSEGSKPKNNLWIYMLFLTIFLIIFIFIAFKLKWLNMKS